MSANKIRSYSELSRLETFEERYKYLRLSGAVGSDTFGFDRYLNQQLYRSKEWKDVRNQVIVRDLARDLGAPGHELSGKILVHHINPINIEDIENSTEFLLNPEYLICVSMDTHNAIHYGPEKFEEKNRVVTRASNDTCPWKNK